MSYKCKININNMSEFWLGSLCISDFKSFVPGSGHLGGGISSTRMVELDMPEELCRCIQHLGDRVLVSVLRGSRESRLILMEESSASHRGGNSARSQSSSSSTWGFIRHTQCRLPILHVVGGLNPERSARLVKRCSPRSTVLPWVSAGAWMSHFSMAALCV